MGKVICCGMSMQKIRSGILVEETLPLGEPYKLWHADQFLCNGCGRMIISDFADRPVAHVHDEKYSIIRSEFIKHTGHIINFS